MEFSEQFIGSLKIGVPSNGAFNQFVNVTHDKLKNETFITAGFSINVFKAVVGLLPYDLQYKFVPFNGSYDEMVDQVYNKVSKQFSSFDDLLFEIFCCICLIEILNFVFGTDIRWCCW